MHIIQQTTFNLLIITFTTMNLFAASEVKEYKPVGFPDSYYSMLSNGSEYHHPQKIAEDGSGNIYFASFNGIYKYDRDQDSVYHIVETIANDTSGYLINQVISNKNGDVYYCSVRGWFKKVVNDTGVVVRLPNHHKLLKVNAVHEFDSISPFGVGGGNKFYGFTPDNEFWVSSGENEIAILKDSTWYYEHIWLKIGTTTTFPSSNTNRWIMLDEYGAVWFNNTQYALLKNMPEYLLNPSADDSSMNVIQTSLSANNVVRDNMGGIWVPAGNSILKVGSNGSVIDTISFSSEATDIAFDDEGYMWILGGGLTKYDVSSDTIKEKIDCFGEFIFIDSYGDKWIHGGNKLIRVKDKDTSIGKKYNSRNNQDLNISIKGSKVSIHTSGNISSAYLYSLRGQMIADVFNDDKSNLDFDMSQYGRQMYVLQMLIDKIKVHTLIK